jgi:hypothetical protein
VAGEGVRTDAISCPRRAAARKRCGAERGPRRQHRGIRRDGPRLCSAPPKRRCAASGARAQFDPSRFSCIRHAFALSRLVSPELFFPFHAPKTRGRREGRVPAGTRKTPVRKRCTRKCTGAIQGSRDIRPSPRSGWNGLISALSPETNSFLPPSPRETRRHRPGWFDAPFAKA